MPSSSRNSRLACAGFAVLMLVGCAGSAPPLPVDTTSVNRSKSVSLADFSAADAQLSCEQIDQERQDIAATMKEANGRIEDNRTQNQVAGYLGAHLLLPLVATEGNQAEKDQIAQLYVRQDILIKLAATKGCRAT